MLVAILSVVAMRAQITLTSAEAKRLIAKAVVKFEVVGKALNNSTIVIHQAQPLLL